MRLPWNKYKGLDTNPNPLIKIALTNIPDAIFSRESITSLDFII